MSETCFLMKKSTLRIHGRSIGYEGEECGIYKLADGLVYRYAVMDFNSLSARINGLSLEQAQKSVSDLQTLAASQVTWKETPHNSGYPVLVGPSPRRVSSQERESIRNLQNLCECILTALSQTL